MLIENMIDGEVPMKTIFDLMDLKEEWIQNPDNFDWRQYEDLPADLKTEFDLFTKFVSEKAINPGSHYSNLVDLLIGLDKRIKTLETELLILRGIHAN